MPTDSNGNHSLPPGYLAVTGQKVLASQHNPPLEDLSSAMTGRLPRNGSAPMGANLPMAGFKVTGLGDATAAGDALTKGQFDAVAVTITGTQTLTNKTLTSPVINDAVVTSANAWAFQPIGVPIPLFDNITGVTSPPKDKAFRYIEMTAGKTGAGGYNEGILTGESVSGSAPLVQATAVISLSGSPINGQTIRLINSERRFLRAGAAGTVENDALQNITGAIDDVWSTGTGTTGAITNTTSGASSNRPGTGVSAARTVTFDASLVARTATETRAKNIGVTYYMRIK